MCKQERCSFRFRCGCFSPSSLPPHWSVPPLSATGIIAVIQRHNPKWPPYFHSATLQEKLNCIQRDPVKIQGTAPHFSALKPPMASHWWEIAEMATIL